VLQVQSLVPGTSVARSWLHALITDLSFNPHPRVLIRDPRRPSDSETVLPEMFQLKAPVVAAARAVTDTYKEVSGDRVVRTVARDSLVDVQGPWLFDRSTLERAIATAQRSGAACSGVVDLCRIAGLPVRLVGIDEA
jgi:2-C-methyl-D-erythritol 4-phosphate cytidylyltransferase